MKEIETSKVHPDAVTFHVITSIMASPSSKPSHEPILNSEMPASALDQYAKSSSEAISIYLWSHFHVLFLIVPQVRSTRAG